MNLFGIGLPEMGIIGIVALLIFGPDKLPEVMGQAGKMLRDFRSMTAGLTGEFEKTMSEAREIGNSVTKELSGVTKEVNKAASSATKSTSKTTTPAPKKGMTSASAKKAGTSTSTSSATKASTASSTPKPSTTTTKAPAGASTAATSSSTTTAKPATSTVVAATPKASREDPIADISLFEQAPLERKQRARRATPTTFGNVDVFAGATAADGDAAAIADALAHGDEITLPSSTDDALSRARQRRQAAGYSQR